jgi:mannose-6-phosphate isomerase-like protein (cupin superfamily)
MTANVSITDNERGTWSYAAGVNGTVVGGTLTINAGDSVVIPAGSSISISPKGNITAPTIVFSAGVTSYFIETVS